MRFAITLGLMLGLLRDLWGLGRPGAAPLSRWAALARRAHDAERERIGTETNPRAWKFKYTEMAPMPPPRREWPRLYTKVATGIIPPVEPAVADRPVREHATAWKAKGTIKHRACCPFSFSCECGECPACHQGNDPFSWENVTGSSGW
jgi:hypothetical protein